MLEPLITDASTSYRRYLLLKYHANLRLDVTALASVWRAQHDALTGSTELPVGFPFLVLLQSKAYSAWEDLDGATVDELCRNIGLGPMDAAAVIAAFERLPIPS